jgi:predicted RNA-binding protein with PUA-like domain
MNCWIFRCDPKKYNIDARLKDANRLTNWRVNQHRKEIHTGDVAFVWAGTKGGIRTILRIISEPYEMPEMVHELRYCGADLDIKAGLRVEAKYLDVDVHLLLNKIKEVPGLEHLSIFTGYHQQTNYPVTPEEGKKLLKLIGARID